MTPKIPTLLLHGFMGTTLAHFGKTLKYWYNQFPIVGIDLPGHGRCNLDASKDYYAASTEYVLGKLSKYDKVNVVGLSYLGGTIALKLAQQQPESISKLVLSGFTYDIPEPSFCSWSNNFQLLVDSHLELAQEYEKLHGSRWKETMACVIQDINYSYESRIKTCSQQLQLLQLPVMLINGDHKENEVKAALDFGKLSKNFSSIIIEEAGHIVTFDKPLEFSHNAKNFLYEMLQ